MLGTLTCAFRSLSGRGGGARVCAPWARDRETSISISYIAEAGSMANFCASGGQSLPGLARRTWSAAEVQAWRGSF
jgi:hypothetical protein